jgi:hypothetical protein
MSRLRSCSNHQAGKLTMSPVVAVTLLTILTSGCANLPVQRLPAYDQATALFSPLELRCYEERSLDKTQLPELVPYATVSTSYSGDKMPTTRSLVRQVEPSLHPDVILLYSYWWRGNGIWRLDARIRERAQCALPALGSSHSWTSVGRDRNDRVGKRCSARFRDV